MAEGVPGDARVEIRPVLGVADHVIFWLLGAAGLAALAAFAVTWLTLGPGDHPWIYLVLTGLLALFLANQQGRWFLLLPMRRPAPLAAPAGLRVAAVTTFVPAAEPMEMIERTLRALVAIRYPHDTWLLDEGDDPAVRKMCARLGVRHFSRRHEARYRTDDGVFRAGSKHGNYNAWLDAEGFRSYDVLAAFDPDHVPLPGFLDETLGYFRDPAVGYVQAAQAYYNQAESIVAGGAAEETYAYFSSVQMAAYGMGYPIIVGGHNLHRIAALEALGGMAVHDADDLLLTLRYRAAGWDGVYLPHILARGLTPADWGSYLVQQRRWSRSVLELKLRNRAPYAARLPLRSRVMSFLHGINFLHRSLLYLGGVGVVLYLLATGGRLAVLSPLLFAPALALGAALGAQELFRQGFYLDRRNEWGLHWRAGLLGFAKWPWFLLALGDVLAGRRIGYVTTPKTQGGVYRPFVVWNACLFATIVVAWGIGRMRGQADPAVESAGAVLASLALALAVNGLLALSPPGVSGPRRDGVVSGTTATLSV